MQWMAWTLPTALFFIVVALMLITMTAWQLASPTVPRRGLLPMVTTRGDRLFVGLLGSAYISLAGIYVTEWSSWSGVAGTLIAAAVYLVLVMRWA